MGANNTYSCLTTIADALTTANAGGQTLVARGVGISDPAVNASDLAEAMAAVIRAGLTGRPVWVMPTASPAPPGPLSPAAAATAAAATARRQPPPLLLALRHAAAKPPPDDESLSPPDSPLVAVIARDEA